MVKLPLYPLNSKVKAALEILDGIEISLYKSMFNEIQSLRGTPQNPVNWTNPDEWIKERLKGSNADLAEKIWKESEGKINPRHIHGIVYLIEGYELILDVKGKYKISEIGKKFIKNDFSVIRKIDWEEGLAFILLEMSQHDKGKRATLLPEWHKFLLQHSNVKELSVAKDYLRRRINNLAERGWIKRDGNVYQITSFGREYLQGFDFKIPKAELNEEARLTKEIDKFMELQKKLLKERIEKMNPISFEYMIKDLLEAIGYEDVEVTSPTHDKGVDVAGTIQNGITTVREVIQVKRVQGNIRRNVIDELRGSLHRFKAFRGTIITIGDFAKGTVEASLENAAPITLINGDTLIEMLIKHEIGISPKNAKYYTLDETYFIENNNALVEEQ